MPIGGSRNEDETTTDNSSLDGHNKACSSSSLGSVSEDETEIKRPFSYNIVPPPYVKQKLKKGETNMKKPTESEALPQKELNHDPEKPIPRSVRGRPLKPPHENSTLSDSKTCGTAKLEDSSGKESEKAKKHRQTIITKDRDNTTGPEMLRRTAGHVHPSLPDYDDLSGRLAALKKTTQTV